MTTFDYILLAAAAVLLVYQLRLLLRARREITIPGKAPSRGAVVVLVVVLLALALFRTQDLTHTWPVFVLVILACLTIFAGGCGLSDKGMFAGGRYIAFDQAAYYEMDERNGRRVLRLSRLTRETHMIVTDEQLPAVLTLLEGSGVPKYEDYRRKMAKSAATRAEAQARNRQSRKKKKK